VRWLRGSAHAPAHPDVDAQVVDGLRHPDHGVRAASARTCGICRLEPAVPLLAERLADPHPRVRVAAARALGRIGGTRAADTLLRALRAGRLSAGRVAMEIARAAPDHYVVAEVERAENHDLRAPLVLAAALRRRPFPIEILLELMQGSEAERAAACHALGVLGHSEAAPLLIDELFDHSPRVRRAARSALNRLGVRDSVPEVLHTPRDRQPAHDRSPLARLGAWRARR
jgi:HEAT repeat protein